MGAMFNSDFNSDLSYFNIGFARKLMLPHSGSVRVFGVGA